MEPRNFTQLFAYSRMTMNQDNVGELIRLCDEVEMRHRVLIRHGIASIEQKLSEMVSNRKSKGLQLALVLKKFQAVADLLSMHIQKEELVTLPYIRKLTQCSRSGSKPPAANFTTVLTPLGFAADEHREALEGVLEIRTLTENYRLPNNENAELSALFGMIEEFERTLKMSIKIESEVLFPKAINLETELNDIY